VSSESHAKLELRRVAYRETITKASESEVRVEQQLDGKEQFAFCKIRLEPLEAGSGFEF